MPQTVYLDEQGNPIQAGAPAATGVVYLDDDGNPIERTPDPMPADATDPSLLPPSSVAEGDPMSANRQHWEAEIERLKALRVAPIPMAPSAAGPVLGGGLRAGQRLISGAKAVATNAMPAVKYEVAKHGLEAVGLPSSLSTPAAMVLSGMGRAGAKPAPTPRAARATASPASRAASTRATPVPPAAPSAPATAPTSSAGPKSARPHPEGGVWSPQRIQNELGLTARRTGQKLTEPEYAKAAELVARGKSPAEAIKATVSARGAGTAGATAKVKLTAAEGKVYMQLRGRGKSHAETVQAIEHQRALAARMGTPSSEAVRAKVAERNVTGRWPK